MTPSLITLPVRVGLRGAQLGLQITAAATDRALGVIGAVADAASRTGDPDADLDLDGQPLGGMPAPPAPRAAGTRAPAAAPAPDPVPRPPPAPDPVPPPAPPAPRASARTGSPAEPPPAPPGPPPPHISTESALVGSVAEPGAQDGAGATIRVEEPWEGYDKLRAADIVERITGADVAQLGAIELYEQTARRRRTVLDAVGRALRGVGSVAVAPGDFSPRPGTPGEPELRAHSSRRDTSAHT